MAEPSSELVLTQHARSEMRRRGIGEVTVHEILRGRSNASAGMFSKTERSSLVRRTSSGFSWMYTASPLKW